MGAGDAGGGIEGGCGEGGCGGGGKGDGDAGDGDKGDGDKGGGGGGSEGTGDGGKGDGGGGNGGGGDGAITVTRISTLNSVSTLTLPAATTTLSWASSPAALLLSATFRAPACNAAAMEHTDPLQSLPPAPSVTIRVAVTIDLIFLGSHVVYSARGGGGDGCGGAGGGGVGGGAWLTTEMTSAEMTSASNVGLAVRPAMLSILFQKLALLISVFTPSALSPLASVHNRHSLHTAAAVRSWLGSVCNLQLSWLDLPLPTSTIATALLPYVVHLP